MKKYILMLMVLIFPLILTGCLDSETIDVQELQKNQQELQQLITKVEKLENKMNELNDNMINMENSLSENDSLIINSLNAYKDNDTVIIEFEILNSESNVYGFEIIKYEENGSATLIIPDYHLDIIPNNSQYDSKKVRLEFNDNEDIRNFIVMVYEFKTGRFQQLIWEYVEDI